MIFIMHLQFTVSRNSDTCYRPNINVTSKHFKHNDVHSSSLQNREALNTTTNRASWGLLTLQSSEYLLCGSHTLSCLNRLLATAAHNCSKCLQNQRKQTTWQQRLLQMLRFIIFYTMYLQAWCMARCLQDRVTNPRQTFKTTFHLFKLLRCHWDVEPSRLRRSKASLETETFRTETTDDIVMRFPQSLVSSILV